MRAATLQRAADWPGRLACFVETRRMMPFAWGVNDCCLLAADWVFDATGTDLAARLRGRYSTALGAARVARAAGIATSSDPVGVRAWPRHLGLCHEVSPRCISRGDLALVSARRGRLLALGVCLGTTIISPGLSEAAFTPTARAIAGWRI